MSRVWVEFNGGPEDGRKVETDGDEFEPGVCYQVLVEGTFVYESNGPLDCCEGSRDNPICLTYAGPKATVHHDRPDVRVICW